MSLHQAAYFIVALVLFVLTVARGRLQLFLALTVAAIGFGYAAGMSTAHVGKAFSLGFGQTVNALGLTVVGAAFIAAIADAAGATGFLAEKARGWRTRSLPLAILGLVAGIASTPAAAFAVLSPLRRAISDSPRGALVLGLALSGSHGVLIPAPVMLASATILGADWALAAGIGLPLAALLVLVGTLFARPAASGEAAAVAMESDDLIDGSRLHAPRRAMAALVAVSLVLVAMLAVQSLGDIASEPLGGGSNREFLIALGRPVILLLVGTGLMLVLSGHWTAKGFSEEGWAGRALVRAASLVLLVGAAGGLQKIAQETGMAEMNAERLLGWAPPGPLALLLPFALAAIVKTLQGSSLVAAITAAGMMMELVGPLGLDDPAGRTLAALGVGAGAMCAPHINDGFFWLVSRAGRLGPGAGLARLSLGAVLQGLVAITALMLIRLIAT
ncbi:GntP family permease [Ancylobacter pratisalsi]|uniref:GntP family permease n=1 Tax=Ancylobacter pratisalsi TaxID=1745854 RepID=A0A6P1YNA5_9HYPH|nr:GntP family permease [Ancylobacter pratisalsi]QIB34937.1 GntP family permease [Ancylobacter pratisalsi]